MQNPKSCCFCPLAGSVVTYDLITALVFQYNHSNLRGAVEAVWQEEGGPAACLCDGLLFSFPLILFLLSSPLHWKGHEVWLAGQPIDWVNRRPGR